MLFLFQHSPLTMIDTLSLHDALPISEHTEGYEGFYHLISIHGDVEKTEVHYIIRDHDRDKFEERKRTAERFVAEIDRKSTRLNSSHVKISYAVFCLKKKKKK